MTTKSHHSATTSSTTSTTNEDNSNPQQGSTRTKAATNQPAEKRQHRETSKMSFKIPPTQRDGRKLFVGGLPQGITNERFQTYFEKFGTILDSVVMVHPMTKASRGFGFVTFEDPLVATNIVENNIKPDSRSKVNICGKWCEVKFSIPKQNNYIHFRRDDEIQQEASFVTTAFPPTNIHASVDADMLANSQQISCMQSYEEYIHPYPLPYGYPVPVPVSVQVPLPQGQGPAPYMAHLPAPMGNYPYYEPCAHLVQNGYPHMYSAPAVFNPHMDNNVPLQPQPLTHYENGHDESDPTSSPQAV